MFGAVRRFHHETVGQRAAHVERIHRRIAVVQGVGPVAVDIDGEAAVGRCARVGLEQVVGVVHIGRHQGARCGRSSWAGSLQHRTGAIATDHRGIVNPSNLDRRRGPAKRPVAQADGVGKAVMANLTRSKILEVRHAVRRHAVGDFAIGPDFDERAILAEVIGIHRVLDQQVRGSGRAFVLFAVIQGVEGFGLAAQVVGHHRQRNGALHVCVKTGLREGVVIVHRLWGVVERDCGDGHDYFLSKQKRGSAGARRWFIGENSSVLRGS